MTPINVVSLKAERQPGGGVVLTISTRYGGDTTYVIAADTLQPLISELLTANGVGPSVADSAAATNSKKFAKKSDGSNSGSARAGDARVQIPVRAPKRWVLGNGLPNHPVVVFVVDPETEQQAGYAFDSKAAREMATGLLKNADAIATYAKKSTGK
jgi:hypothetical protein